MGRLSGGRRPAPRGASSDPTVFELSAVDSARLATVGTSQFLSAGMQFVHGGHQMFQATTQAVQFPDDEGITRLQRLLTSLQVRAVISLRLEARPS